MSSPPEIAKINLQTRSEFYYIDACGDEARRWLSELCDVSNARLRLIIKDSMLMLRRHELTGGLDLLASVDQQLRSKVCEFPSIISLMRRFENAARAYADYLIGDLESAKTNLSRAHREISRIIELHEFLIPLAIHCTDFVIQRARIARRERRWAEVKGHLDILERIFASRHPYCVLDSGKLIMLSDIRQFLESLPLNEGQRERTRSFLGEDSPIRERIGQIEELIFSLPDMVIPYP